MSKEQLEILGYLVAAARLSIERTKEKGATVEEIAGGVFETESYLRAIEIKLSEWGKNNAESTASEYQETFPG
jgi:hypothetical protein